MYTGFIFYTFYAVIHLLIAVDYMGGSRRGTGGPDPPPPPLKNHKKIRVS